VASRGSLTLLGQQVERARFDYRDVITAGEYDSAGRKVRDLRVSFLLDSPQAFWLGEVACMMAARGYTLSSVDCRPATAPPFACVADRGEGLARFVGPEGDIEVEKSDRRWSIREDLDDIRQRNLDRVFDDESAFRDAVSGFILTRRRPRRRDLLRVRIGVRRSVRAPSHRCEWWPGVLQQTVPARRHTAC
jgi:hypothetical protein